MGLTERRKMQELQTGSFPERTAELAEITGGVIAYNVDWDSFANDIDGLNFLDNLSCHRTNMALRVICADKVGKEAVRDGLKTIKLKNVPTKEEMKISFGGGVLEMHCAYALRTDGMFSDNTIREVLMQGL
jgi:hypothetical protein